MIAAGGRAVLILTSSAVESLMIRDEVTLTVLGVNGNQVPLGINAPKTVSVRGGEIYKRIKRELGQGDWG